mmetsp:Transcript_23009/g.71386  ORF Transcript_23009/g.71386 Transcript_23009/m.71386 type:complete len:212 (+) Transcript_23009:1656-2291(+)
MGVARKTLRTEGRRNDGRRGAAGDGADGGSGGRESATIEELLPPGIIPGDARKCDGPPDAYTVVGEHCVRLPNATACGRSSIGRRWIASNRSRASVNSHGSFPYSSAYSVIPSAHTSTASPSASVAFSFWWLSPSAAAAPVLVGEPASLDAVSLLDSVSSSGARNAGVPRVPATRFASADTPKSARYTVSLAPSRMFSGLMSRWITPLRCR